MFNLHLPLEQQYIIDSFCEALITHNLAKIVKIMGHETQININYPFFDFLMQNDYTHGSVHPIIEHIILKDPNKSICTHRYSYEFVEYLIRFKESGPTIKLFLEHGLDPNNMLYTKPLAHLCIEADSLDNLEIFLNYGVNVNSENDRKLTILEAFLKKNDNNKIEFDSKPYNIIEKLLSCGARIEDSMLEKFDHKSATGNLLKYVKEKENQYKKLTKEEQKIFISDAEKRGDNVITERLNILEKEKNEIITVNTTSQEDTTITNLFTMKDICQETRLLFEKLKIENLTGETDD